jgi:ribosomal protein S18 acetylase RimI-like enzyme
MSSRIRDLIVKAIHENKIFFPQVNSDEYADKLLNNATIFSEKIDGKEIAFIAFYDNDKSNHTAYMSLIYISPEARRKRIGVQLIKKAIHHLKTKGFIAFGLEVHKKNLAAIQLYQSVGFKKTFEKDEMIQMEYLLTPEKL